MNTYLSEKIGQAHRAELIAEAATIRLGMTASTGRVRRSRNHFSVRAAIRRAISAPAGLDFLPRLADYPSARN